ncbi:uncharacterized protein LOC110806629 [Carica papaya]|uniref:uncharacterized protein LOC110806629 n=1 Tax=Carica papaya TaxID=3649 RepID=UPI000B8D0C0F|nr:uncharacterized protein LOC110806629 [Carica papaya]
MGRDNSDPIMIQSSIALLQERFRQLQRVKEMREERELLKNLIETKQQTPGMHYNEPSSQLFFHFLPPRSPPPSLSLDSQIKVSGFDKSVDSPLLMGLWPKEKPAFTMNRFDGSDPDEDVDTSLHL